jgi:lysozyme family protein
MTLDPTLIIGGLAAILLAEHLILIIALVVMIMVLVRGQRAPSFPPAVQVQPPEPVEPPPAVLPVPAEPPAAPPVAAEPVPPDKPAAPAAPAPVPAAPVGPAPVPIAPAVPPAVASDDFDKCVALVLQWEGGNDDDPRDPGGRTSRGILQREWDAWRSAHPGLPSDVWQAPQGQMLAIYKQQYWDMLSCDSLPSGVDYAVFDYGVNSGISRSAKVLEGIVGTATDGHIGPLTIAATAKADPATVINQICDQRMAFLQGLSIWPTFGHGWTNRVNGVRAGALSMAGAVPKLPAPASAPAPAPSAAPSPAPATGGTILQHNAWPSQSQAMSYFGDPGSSGWEAANLVYVTCPWTLNLEGTSTTRIRIHRLCAASLTRVLNYIWEQCGKSQAQIDAFGYNVFDGSYVGAGRVIAGTSTLSEHAYGAALDFNAAANPQHAPLSKTKFKEDSLIVFAFKGEGWTWGGNWSPAYIDAMHFQALHT